MTGLPCPSARRSTEVGPADGPLERSTTAILEGWQRCLALARLAGAVATGAFALRNPAALAAGGRP